MAQTFTNLSSPVSGAQEESDLKTDAREARRRARSDCHESEHVEHNPASNAKLRGGGYDEGQLRDRIKQRTYPKQTLVAQVQ